MFGIRESHFRIAASPILRSHSSAHRDEEFANGTKRIRAGCENYADPANK
jgi:hypothetical protein